MSIKSKIVNKESKEIDYPCLMIETDGAIVLMCSHKHGLVVSAGNSSYKIGYFSDTWVMHLFTVFDGKVILSNEK